jgi:hypothetical protein
VLTLQGFICLQEDKDSKHGSMYTCLQDWVRVHKNILVSTKCMYEGESINKVNLSTASTRPFCQLTVTDNIANFVSKLLILYVQTCSNEFMST